MPTTYLGREDEHDLGEGRSFVWLVDAYGKAFGIVEHHPAPGGQEGAYCGGYVAWRVPADEGAIPRHKLITEDPLHIEPSLLCRTCGHHGWIRDGRWLDAA